MAPYALVTGASSGIGWHLSIELAKRGYSIIGISNQPDQLEHLKDTLQQDHDVDCITLNIDLSKTDSAQTVYSFCQAKYVQPEILVNNAGMLVLGEFLSQEPNKVDQITTLHMTLPTQLCHLFGNDMRERGKGYILNVSSISSVMPYPVISLYGPTKTYLRAHTKALRTEFSDYNINVSCLIPGATNTPLNDQLNANIDLAIKLGVMMQPERVAHKAIRGLFKGKAEIVPGLINKLTLIFLPLIPRFIVNGLYRSRIGRKLRR